MHAAEWIALSAPAMTLIGVGVALIIRATRLVDAVKDVGESLKAVVSRVDDHESRIRDLEH